MRFDFSGFEQMNAIAVTMADNRLRTLRAGDALVRSAGFALVSWGQRFAPVDTGSMRAGIGVDFAGSAMGGVYTATAGPVAKYAPFVEYGTSRQPPQAFMGPALDRVSGAFLLAVAAMGDPLAGPGVVQGGNFA